MTQEKLKAVTEKVNEMLNRHKKYLRSYEEVLKERNEEDEKNAQEIGVTIEEIQEKDEPTIYWRDQMEEDIEIEKFVVSEFEEILNLLIGEGE